MKIHFWHKWETETTDAGHVTASSLFNKKEQEREVVIEIQICKKCNAKRGVLHFLNGERIIVHPAFVEEHLKKKGKQK